MPIYAGSQPDSALSVIAVLEPGRYAINAIIIDKTTKKVIGTPRKKSDYVEIIELWEPKIIPAG